MSEGNDIGPLRLIAFREDRGFRHYSIATLWEAARYERDLAAGTTGGVKLNNDFRSRIARELMDREPTLRDFFETRGLKA